MDVTTDASPRAGRVGSARADRSLVVRSCVVWASVIGAGIGALLLAAPDLRSIGTELPPLHGVWDWRPGRNVLIPVVIAGAAVAGAPRCAARWPWRRVLVGSTCLAAAWAVALALVDGTSGLLAPVTNPHEYLAGVTKVGSIGAFIRGFATHLAGYPVHVQGHPPGYPLVVWLLDRIGAGPTGITTLQIAGGALAVPAVLVAVRAIAGEPAARAAAPFVALAPAALWIASSADALFTGIGAWAVACAILAVVESDRRRSDRLAAAGGLLFGALAFLSYGLVLLGFIPLVVAVSRRRARPLLVAAVAAAIVFAAWLAAGFWWVAGIAATRARYVAGIASRRPFTAFALSNLACVAIVTGPAVAVGLGSLRDRRLWLIVGAALGVILLADVSGMSKGEVERIWLPFTIWLLPAAAALSPLGRAPVRASRWLAAQAVFTILLQTGVRTPW